MTLPAAAAHEPPDQVGLALSALFDDELDAAELEVALHTVLARPEAAVERWSVYQAVRHSLRDGLETQRGSDARFLACLHRATGTLRQHDQPVDATVFIAPLAGVTGFGTVLDGQKPSANAPLGGWRVVAAAASLAALALLAWQALPGQDDHTATPQLAQSVLGPMQRDPQLDALLAAHGEVATGLPSPAAEVRRAALVGVAR